MKLKVLVLAIMLPYAPACAQLLPVSRSLQQRPLPNGVTIPVVTSASVSYPGCPGEVTSHTNTWTFDSVNGFNQNNYAAGTGGAPLVTTIGGVSGQGTATHPWNDLNALTGSAARTPESGYSLILLATAAGATGSSPILAGDLILVNTGTYGKVQLGYGNNDASQAIVNVPAITIEAGTGQIPVLSWLAAPEMTGLHINRIKIQSINDDGAALLNIPETNVANSVSDIIVENSDISSAPVATANGWDLTTWIDNTRLGLLFQAVTVLSPSTAPSCVSAVNNHIYEVGATASAIILAAIEDQGNSSLIQGNTIDHMFPSGIDLYGSNFAIGYNTIQDFVETSQHDTQHYAIYAAQNGPLNPTVYQSNIYVYNNKMIQSVDQNQLLGPAPANFFLNSAGDMTNVVIWDNLAQGGGASCIGTGNTHDGMITNNSCMYVGSGQNMEINVAQGHAGSGGFGTGPIGRPPSNLWVQNNIANIFNYAQGTPQVNHNISAPGSTGFSSWTYVGTDPNINPPFNPGWNIVFAFPTPGSVITLPADSGQQNLIDGGVSGGSPQAHVYTTIGCTSVAFPCSPQPNFTPINEAVTAGGLQLIPPITDFNGVTFTPPYAIGALN
jgi:hypothetical protein